MQNSLNFNFLKFPEDPCFVAQSYTRWMFVTKAYNIWNDQQKYSSGYKMHLLKTNIAIGGQPGSKIHYFNANAHKLSLKHRSSDK